MLAQAQENALSVQLKPEITPSQNYDGFLELDDYLGLVKTLFPRDWDSSYRVQGFKPGSPALAIEQAARQGRTVAFKASRRALLVYKKEGRAQN